jgi:acyl-CoA thioester hydrolase
MASVCCEYKYPAKYDDLLSVHTRVAEFKGATIIMAYEIYMKETGALVVTGETKHPITDNKLRPIRLRNVAPEIYNILKESV